MAAPAEAPALVVSRLIHAPPERVFRAWSDPDVAARWGWGNAYDTIAIELDCRPGGTWRHQIRDRNTGETFFFDGVFREVERPVYGEAMTAQIESAVERLGAGSLDKLLHSGDTWTVS